MRLGNKKEKKCFFILYCSHLVLSLNKIGGGSEKSKIKTTFFICLFTHLSLSLNKIGCGSAIKIKKIMFFHFVLLSPFTIFAEKYCDAEYGNFKY